MTGCARRQAAREPSCQPLAPAISRRPEKAGSRSAWPLGGAVLVRSRRKRLDARAFAPHARRPRSAAAVRCRVGQRKRSLRRAAPCLILLSNAAIAATLGIYRHQSPRPIKGDSMCKRLAPWSCDMGLFGELRSGFRLPLPGCKPAASPRPACLLMQAGTPAARPPRLQKHPTEPLPAGGRSSGRKTAPAARPAPGLRKAGSTGCQLSKQVLRDSCSAPLPSCSTAPCCVLGNRNGRSRPR